MTSSAITHITASAPASLMIAGEHAVLQGHPAIVCAIDKRLTVILTPRTDQQFVIHSQHLGTFQGDLNHIQVIAPFQFIIHAIQSLQTRFTFGFELHILSDFAPTLGFGSSAAVTVATIAVLTRWLQLGLSLEQIFQQSFSIISAVQEVGSGADVAASVFGGIGFYQQQPFSYEKLEHFPHLAVVYSGSKKPTPVVVKKIQHQQELHPQLYQSLFEKISHCTFAMRQVINQEQWVECGNLCNEHYQLQIALGVSNNHLDHLIQQLRQQPNIYGAKISGAGLGDCIIGIGELASHIFPSDDQQKQQGVQQLAVQITATGVRYE